MDTEILTNMVLVSKAGMKVMAYFAPVVVTAAAWSMITNRSLRIAAYIAAFVFAFIWGFITG